MDSAAQIAARLAQYDAQNQGWKGYLYLADQARGQPGFSSNLTLQQDVGWLEAAAMIDAPAHSAFGIVGNTDFTVLGIAQTDFKTFVFTFNYEAGFSQGENLSAARIQSVADQLREDTFATVETEVGTGGFLTPSDINILDVNRATARLGLPSTDWAGAPLGALFGVPTSLTPTWASIVGSSAADLGGSAITRLSIELGSLPGTLWAQAYASVLSTTNFLNSLAGKIIRQSGITKLASDTSGFGNDVTLIARASVNLIYQYYQTGVAARGQVIVGDVISLDANGNPVIPTAAGSYNLTYDSNGLHAVGGRDGAQANTIDVPPNITPQTPANWNGVAFAPSDNGLPPTPVGPISPAAATSLAPSLGLAFGSTLGRYLVGSNPILQVAVGSVLGAVALDLGKQIAASQAAGQFQSLDTAGQDAASSKSVWNDFGNDLTLVGTSAAVGTISSYLSLELGQALGLKGFGAELFSAGTGGVLGHIAVNLLASNVPVFQGLVSSSVLGAAQSNIFSGSGGALESSFVAFFATKLGELIVQPQTQAGAILSSLGAAIGALGTEGGGLLLGGFVEGAVVDAIDSVLTDGAAELVSQVFDVIPGIGIFIGFVLGALIGNLFGHKKPRIPTATASTVLQIPTAHYALGATTVANGGDLGLTVSMASAARDTLNGLITLITRGQTPAYVSNLTSPTQIYGDTGGQLSVTLGNVVTNVTTGDQAVDRGVLWALPQTQIIGGDLIHHRRRGGDRHHRRRPRDRPRHRRNGRRHLHRLRHPGRQQRHDLHRRIGIEHPFLRAHDAWRDGEPRYRPCRLRRRLQQRPEPDRLELQRRPDAGGGRRHAHRRGGGRHPQRRRLGRQHLRRRLGHGWPTPGRAGGPVPAWRRRRGTAEPSRWE